MNFRNDVNIRAVWCAYIADMTDELVHSALWGFIAEILTSDTGRCGLSTEIHYV